MITFLVFFEKDDVVPSGEWSKQKEREPSNSQMDAVKVWLYGVPPPPKKKNPQDLPMFNHILISTKKIKEDAPSFSNMWNLLFIIVIKIWLNIDNFVFMGHTVKQYINIVIMLNKQFLSFRMFLKVNETPNRSRTNVEAYSWKFEEKRTGNKKSYKDFKSLKSLSKIGIILLMLRDAVTFFTHPS